jgi:hypothetical protein
LETDPFQQLKRSELYWTREFSSPTWYLSIVPEREEMLMAVRLQPRTAQEEFKTNLYEFFARQLDVGNISLGGSSGLFDMQRKNIDAVIIHHTSNAPGLSPSLLSAIELVRLYAPYFASPTAEEDQYLKGKPIFSGHVRNGKQVFWPYHWMIRSDGRAERLLRDAEIGWHAGDWDVNCRSAAIVLDNDYEHGRPGECELWAIARIIACYYDDVPLQRIIGHREVSARTGCPSELFIDGEERGWKSDLLAVVERLRTSKNSKQNCDGN